MDVVCCYTEDGEKHEAQQYFNRQEQKKRDKARDTFDDILGNSNSIQYKKKIAKKMAKTKSAVLITRESGVRTDQGAF